LTIRGEKDILVISKSEGDLEMNNEDKIISMLVEIKNDITEIKNDITEIRGEIKEIRGEIAEINTRLDRIEKKQVQSNKHLSSITRDVKYLMSSVEHAHIDIGNLDKRTKMTLRTAK
jgi:predicted  nucleic acid-binding Zn-ribbon protein